MTVTYAEYTTRISDVEELMDDDARALFEALRDIDRDKCRDIVQRFVQHGVDHQVTAGTELYALLLILSNMLAGEDGPSFQLKEVILDGFGPLARVLTKMIGACNELEDDEPGGNA